MPDTHDDGSGDEYIARANRQVDKCRERGRASLADVEALRNDVEELAEQLADATARAEKAEARIAELGEPAMQQRIVSPGGLAYTPTYRDFQHRADWLPGVRLEERQVYPTPWRVAANAPQDGLSATETDADGVRQSVDGNTSSITPQGLSEPEPPRDPSAWCWAPNPAGRLHCGLLRNHKPPHMRGERTWWTSNDTTEGR